MNNPISRRALRLLSLRDEAGKFTKAEAYYVNDSAQKPFRCGNCQFYDGENGACDLVSEQGPPNPGTISRQGACSLFNARIPRITAMKWLWGRSGRQGVTPEIARATAYMITYAALDEEPPTELEEKSLISGDRIRSLWPR